MITMLLASPAACAPAAGAQTRLTLTVFAASSLSSAFAEMAAGFEALNPGVQIVFNFAGSQQLASQLTEGAPADLFASADWENMNKAEQAGLLSLAGPQIFARNQLALIVPKDNPPQLTSLQELAVLDLHLVLAAPEVPLGGYSQALLQQAAQHPGYPPQFQAKVLERVMSYEDSARSVFSKVSLGEADAGIVYQSDVSSAHASQVTALPIPNELNIISEYPLALLKNTQSAGLAQLFIEYVLSPAGQQILESHGFLPGKP